MSKVVNELNLDDNGIYFLFSGVSLRIKELRWNNKDMKQL